MLPLLPFLAGCSATGGGADFWRGGGGSPKQGAGGDIVTHQCGAARVRNCNDWRRDDFRAHCLGDHHEGSDRQHLLFNVAKGRSHPQPMGMDCLFGFHDFCGISRGEGGPAVTATATAFEMTFSHGTREKKLWRGFLGRIHMLREVHEDRITDYFCCNNLSRGISRANFECLCGGCLWRDANARRSP